MADASALKKIACQAIDNHAQALRQINRQIWEKPELSNQEMFAHEVLTDFLESEGFQVTRKWTLETAFGGQSGGDSGPCIGVISEYDALPEVGHACGHNLIAESGIAAAIGKAALETSGNHGNQLGKVLVIGSPAEEQGGGKLLMLENGCFKDVDFCMMVHPTPSDSTMPLVLANRSFYVTYKGYAAHAAAFPWEGINALDAAVMAYNSVSALRQQMKPTWRVHGVILEGGVKPYIIPDRSRLHFVVRAPNVEDLNRLSEKVIYCFEGAASATGCSLEINKSAGYLDLKSNITMASLYQKNAETLGVQFPSLAEQKQTVLGSTDMGNVSYVIPSIHPIYSIDSMAVNHSYAFTTAAGTDVAHDKTLIAAKAIAMMAVDLFCRQDLREQAKREFNEIHCKH